MRCEAVRYNSPIQRVPVFQARRIKLDWNSESAKFIENTMLATSMATVAYACLSVKKGGLVTQEMLDVYIYFNNKTEAERESILRPNIREELEVLCKNAKDSKLLDKLAQLYKDALKNRDVLRGGYADLSDKEIKDCILGKESTVNALNILGIGTLEAAFGLDIISFAAFCDDLFTFTNRISQSNLELLKSKLNPESTKEYRDLEEELYKYKKQINKELSSDDRKTRKRLVNKIQMLKSEDKSDLRIKELKKQIQALYINSENSKKIMELMQKVNQIQCKMNDIRKKKVDLPPQEIIKKIRVIISISESPLYNSRIRLHENTDAELIRELENTYDTESGTINWEDMDEQFREKLFSHKTIKKRRLDKDIKELIELIQPSTPENEQLWDKCITQKIFNKLNYKYNETIDKTLDFANYKYLNELLMSDNNFWTNLPSLFNLIFDSDDSDKPVEQILDGYGPNVSTKKQFEKMGVDYNAWAHYNPDSYIDMQLELNAEDAKKIAVKNMCAEILNPILMNNIPAKHRYSFYQSLLNSGIKIDLENKKVLIDGRDVEYTDLERILDVIKKEMNSNVFWSKMHSNSKVDRARSTIYDHYMHQRKSEIDNIKLLKGIETHNIRIQKVNMSDIMHALGLGNDARCCTALGSQANEWSAVTYILYKCFNAIEVLSDGESVGNTMIYIANVDGQLALVLDDIELQTKYQNNEQIKNAIVEYAKKICKEIGCPDMAIYAGPGLHKIDMSEYPLIKRTSMQIKGKTDGSVYLDYDAEPHVINGRVYKTDLYKIRG